MNLKRSNVDCMMRDSVSTELTLDIFIQVKLAKIMKRKEMFET